MQMLRSRTFASSWPVSSIPLRRLRHTKLTGKDLSLENDNVKRKNEDLNQAVREKTRKYLQTQELYDKLKRRAMLGQVQNAASDAVEDTINASGMGGMGGGRFVDRLGDQDIPQRGPLFQDLYASEEQHVPGFSRDPMGMAPPMGRVRAAGENLFSNQDSIRREYTRVSRIR